jgi:hypothetical protein
MESATAGQKNRPPGRIGGRFPARKLVGAKPVQVNNEHTQLIVRIVRNTSLETVINNEFMRRPYVKIHSHSPFACSLMYDSLAGNF